MAQVFRLLARLPLPVLHALGAAVGWLAYLASPTYRRHLRENLARAYPAGSGALHAAIAHAGRTVMELPRIWLRPRGEVLPLVREVSGWELVEAAWREGRGIVFLTPHLGCFEITAQYYAAHAPLTVLYRPPKQRWLQPLVEQGRGGGKLALASADVSGVRLLLRALKRHEAVGLLPDQVPGSGEGAWTPFFGAPAYTMTLAARLAHTPDASVIMACDVRLPRGAGFRLLLRAPRQALGGTLAQRVAGINRELEALIRECPEQYLWGYNRYKRPAGAPPPTAAAAGAAR